jgi:predicted amidophosphoribosyltransferase
VNNAVDRFVHKLINVLAAKVPVAVVPSHEAGDYNPALLPLAKKLVAQGYVDATSSLVRHRTIDSSRALRQCGLEGNDIEIHLNTIKVGDSTRISKSVILLLDNVVTTGTTFMACRKLLLDAGAAEVVCLALGKTIARKAQEPPKVVGKFVVLRRRQ